ncbi:MAG: cysteine desulfurase family protein [Chthonomonadales bacterium]
MNRLNTNVIYLDYAATTPVDEDVIAAMLPFLSERFGNPSSIHSVGQSARAALDEARDVLAAALHCEYSEITFTSGGTEADNLAVAGVMLAAPKRRNRLVVSAVEHHAVLRTADWLETMGFRVTRLAVDREGRVHPEILAAALDDDVALVSIQHANNEIGTVQDVPRLAQIAHEHGALFHTDAVQSMGVLPVHVRGMNVDLLSISAHKIYGPKGVGALYVRSGVRVQPLAWGGAQERERRAGTENVAGIVGFAKAVEIAVARRETFAVQARALRRSFVEALRTAVPAVEFYSAEHGCLPTIVNISLPGVDGAAAVVALDHMGICASSGAACSSGSIEPSHVLQAIGLSPQKAAGGIRFSLGRFTTEEELLRVVSALEHIARDLAPVR